MKFEDSKQKTLSVLNTLYNTIVRGVIFSCSSPKYKSMSSHLKKIIVSSIFVLFFKHNIVILYFFFAIKTLWCGEIAYSKRRQTPDKKWCSPRKRKEQIFFHTIHLSFCSRCIQRRARGGKCCFYKQFIHIHIIQCIYTQLTIYYSMNINVFFFFLLSAKGYDPLVRQHKRRFKRTRTKSVTHWKIIT